MSPFLALHMSHESGCGPGPVRLAASEKNRFYASQKPAGDEMWHQPLVSIRPWGSRFCVESDFGYSLEAVDMLEVGDGEA